MNTPDLCSARNPSWSRVGAVLALVLAAASCKVAADGEPARPPEAATSTPPAAEPEAPSDDPAALLRQAQAAFAVLPSEATNPGNPATLARRELGRMLYFDRRLSKNHDISCNDCHRLDRFGVDGEPTSPGHRGQRGDRNSPTVLNAALHTAQFWDGRAPDVEAQAGGPILNPVEMAMPDEASVERTLRSIPGYAPLFSAAFATDTGAPKQPITFANVALAIAAFERTLLTPGRFDAFLAGDTDALTPTERRGLRTFMAKGCATCHDGPLLGGASFEKRGAATPWPTEDPGRFGVTEDESDRFAFKVPSLRNVAKTGPWFHDGAVVKLPEAVKLMAAHQLDVVLDEAETSDLLAFLDALTGTLDPSVAEPPALPPSGPKTPKPRAPSEPAR